MPGPGSNKTPFLTAPAGVHYLNGVGPGVTGVLPRSTGYTGLTIKSVGVHLSQPKMKDLVRVEILALTSYWGALQTHQNGFQFFKIPL